MLVHATALALAVDADGPLAGVLLLGPPGAGKSAAALAAIEGCPWRRTALVSDDAVVVSPEGVATAPDQIRGLIEVRGFGPALIRATPSVRLIAAFTMSPVVERLPQPGRYVISGGRDLPVYPLVLGDHVGARLRAAVRSILGGQTE